MEYSTILAKQFDIKEEYAANIIALLDDGNTIPFIAPTPSRLSRVTARKCTAPWTTS